MRGAPVDLRGPHLLADNTAVHAEMIALFAEIFAGKFRFPLPEIM